MDKNKSNLYSVIGWVMVVFLVVAQSYVLTNNKSVDEDSLISVSGRSELTVKPDEAEVYLRVVTENDDSKVAQDENKAITNKVVETLKAQGLKEEQIETLNFRLDENYRYDYYIKNTLNTLEEKEKEYKYKATHTIKITTSDLDMVGSYIDIAVKAGVNGIDNVEYTLSDAKEKEIRAQALEKAIIAGREKASSMAKVLNVKLGKVVDVQESNYYYEPFRVESNIKMAVDAVSETGGSSNYLAPQSVEVRSTVQLKFEIE